MPTLVYNPSAFHLQYLSTFLWLLQNLIHAISNISWLLSQTTAHNKASRCTIIIYNDCLLTRNFSKYTSTLSVRAELLFGCAKTSLNTVESLPINIGTSRQKAKIYTNTFAKCFFFFININKWM